MAFQREAPYTDSMYLLATQMIKWEYSSPGS